MIDERCIGPDVDRSKISPDAEVSGASYLTGRRTAVGPGAVVRSARLHDAVIEAGATISDSILLAEGHPHSHACDAAGRTVVRGADQPLVAARASVSGCTLINVAVGEGSRLRDTWARDCRFGPDNAVTDAKVFLANTASGVTIAGPTEISEAYLGDHATIDRRGYYEGLFSNAFHQLRYNESAGRLEVAGTIELPHVSRYGTNTINSTNSGKLLPQPDGVLRSFGEYEGLWADPLLSHEQIELAPCCWVAPWTKVVGQSPAPHHSDEDLVNDEMTTYLMPFAMAGVDGDLTRGLVMPGELSVGIGPKQRRGGWVFTYAPDAVIRMVARLHDALPSDRKRLADTIVVEAIRTAIEMTRAMAGKSRLDLSAPADRQRRGWPQWIAQTYALLNAHLEADLWEFDGGRPTGWRQQAGRWTHPNIQALLAVAPDALDKQVSEEEIFAFEDPIPPAGMAVPADAVMGTRGEADIHAGAQVADDAFVGPGCRIGPGVVIESGASLWKADLVGTKVRAGATVQRSALVGGEVGAGSIVRSCRMVGTTLGPDSTAECAGMVGSKLAAQTTVCTFGSLLGVKTTCGAILGGIIVATQIDTVLMSMHMAGACAHLQAAPTAVELDGKEVLVPAVPMIGGGAVIRGTKAAPVRLECSFIGSNAILEPGCYVGYGCFVLGTLGPDEGLPPLTVSTGGGPPKHQIGGVLGALSSTVITHFINWTFQAVGPDLAPAVAEMTRQAIARGIDAVEWQLARRQGDDDAAKAESFAPYRSLGDYSEAQLRAGLANYRRALDSGAWEIAFRDGQLRFCSDKGHWLERSGSAFWQKH